MTYTFTEYQRAALRSAADLPTDAKLANAGLGLSGEAAETLEAALGLIVNAGKTSETLKKHLAQGHTLDRDKVAKELGDVLWYAALLCETLHLDLGDVASGNIAKLTARYGAKFTPKASIDRDEPTLPAIPSTRRSSGEIHAAFVWAGPGVYRRRHAPPIPVYVAARKDEVFHYVDAEGTRYTMTGGYLADGPEHATDLVGTVVPSAGRDIDQQAELAERRFSWRMSRRCSCRVFTSDPECEEYLSMRDCPTTRRIEESVFGTREPLEIDNSDW